MNNQSSHFSEVKAGIIDNNPPPVADAELSARTERRYSPPESAVVNFAVISPEDKEATKLLVLAERMAWYVRRRTNTGRLRGEDVAARELLNIVRWICETENDAFGLN